MTNSLLKLSEHANCQNEINNLLLGLAEIEKLKSKNLVLEMNESSLAKPTPFAGDLNLNYLIQ